MYNLGEVANYFWYYHFRVILNAKLFHTLSVYEIPAKEHQVVDRWTTDEISVL